MEEIYIMTVCTVTYRGTLPVTQLYHMSCFITQ